MEKIYDDFGYDPDEKERRMNNVKKGSRKIQA